jgi:MFS family permease
MASVTFAPLRHRSFFLALLSNFVSSIGSWMQTVALGVYLTITTHNPEWLGLLMIAGWLPAIIGSPMGGVIADRWNRQRWIQINNFVMMVTASALAVLEITHHLTPTDACYLAIIEGLSSSSSWAAWQSMLRDLVDADEVMAAVSLSSAQFNLGRIIGPVFAGLALALGSTALCFALNAASFAFVVVVYSFVRTAPRDAVTTKVAFFRETAHGACVAWRERGCRNPIIAIALTAFIASPFIALTPTMAIDVLHAGKAGTSWLVTAQGVGAVLGALLLPVWARRRSRIFVLRLSVTTMFVSEFAYAFSPNMIIAMVALVVLGAAYLGLLTGLNTAVQLHAPVSERSRILALYTLSLSIFYPVGSLVQSVLVKSYGLRGVLGVASVTLAGIWLLVRLLAPDFWSQMGTAPSEISPELAD